MSPRAPSRQFYEADVIPYRPPEEADRQHLSDLVFDAIADREVVARLATLIGAENSLARLRAGRTAVARGDFGEVLAGACIEEFEGLHVPVKKLRFKIDPEQTQPGTDVVAFRVTGDEIESIEFIETKLRTVVSRRAAEDAHAQLVADDESGFGDIIEFIAERLADSDPRLFEALMRYLAGRESQDERIGGFGIFLVWDEFSWEEEVLDRLDALDPLLDPLHVRIAHLPALVDLVSDAYSRIGIEALDDGT